MSIWSTLYALRDDDGLESTLIRPVFDGMTDLETVPSGYERFMVSAGGGDYEPFQVAIDDGHQDFQVTLNG